MLKVRVIPTLLFKEMGLVKGIGFNNWRRLDTVLPAIKVYNMREVDELILLDVSATKENKRPDYDSIKEFSQECFVPFTVGGGIKDIDDVKCLLRAGADKVAINTACYDNLELIRKVSGKFGTQCIIVSIDARKGRDGKYYCYSNCGVNPTNIEVMEWAKIVERYGAGEILITSIEKDGTMEGYDINLIKKVTESVSIPVIASGGAGKYEHMVNAIKVGKASAVAAASMYHFTEQTPKEAKKALALNDIAVRNIGIKDKLY